MKNEIIFIRKEQENSFIDNYKDKGFYIAKLNGRKINTVSDYMSAIIVAFKFPNGMFKNTNNFDSYNDWMRDLTWLGEYTGYILIIEYFDQMMKSCKEEKELIMEQFKKIILPFWEKDVEYVVVDGKPKVFNIFIIN